MKFDIMTLFPDLVTTVLSESIIGRAQKNGIIEVAAHNIRDFSEKKTRRVDDTPYGGGMGMLMECEPIYRCFRSVVDPAPENEKRRTVYLSPKGALFTQKTAARLAEYDRLIFLCGHYEGVDERAIELAVDMEISLGDFVLTSGVLPAMTIADAVARLLPGVLGDDASSVDESHSNDLLEYPQYTRPTEFRGLRVPEVLMSGDHGRIAKFRRRQQEQLTRERRPDMWENFMSQTEKEV